MNLRSWARRTFSLKDPALAALLGGGKSKSGQHVTASSALKHSTVWSCVRLKSQTCSTLPIGFYERGDNPLARKAVPDHWLAQILEVSPNADQTPAEFWEGVHGCIALRGNFFARKAGLRSNGQFASLETMHPDSVQGRRENGEIRYRWYDPDGKVYDLGENEVFRVPGLSIGEFLGLPPIHFGRDVIGAGMAAEEQAARMFENGLQAAGFLQSDQSLDKNQRTQLQELMDEFVGSRNAGKLMILEAGLKYSALTLKPIEAQLLEARRFSVEDICRFFGVPPILVGHASQGQTMFGSGVEQIFLMWLVTSLRNDLVRVEQSIRKRLLPAAERHRFYAETNVDALLRADSQGRAALYQALTNIGGITPAEVRRKENLPFKEGSDELLVQGALVKLADLGKVPANDAQAVRSALKAFLEAA
jgi:HK97 family phage portal protein